MIHLRDYGNVIQQLCCILEKVSQTNTKTWLPHQVLVSHCVNNICKHLSPFTRKERAGENRHKRFAQVNERECL